MENKANSMQISVKGIIDIIFRNKMIIVISFCVCIVLTFIAVQFITPVYDATVKMLVRGQSIVASESYAPIMASGVHMTQAEIVKSYPVLKRAAIAMNLQNRPFDYEKDYCSKIKRYYVDLIAKKNSTRAGFFAS